MNITYDRNSNITLIEDNVHTGFDVDYTNDELNRLTKAEEGAWNGSSITSRSRQQIWDDGAGTLGLAQTGNWERVRMDMNGDNDFIDADEYDDDRTHNDVNELTGRDTDDSGSDDYTLVYDETGNLTDDGENYEYVYDAFYRLRQILDTSDQSLIAEYWYNGLGYRITVHQDTDNDDDVDANDKKYHSAYDNRWRNVATYRDTDTDPKEMFIYHAAGLDGRGGSSYIDAMILRDKDANTGWTSASDGTLEQRYYYCQNWRSDVVAMVTAGGYEVEWVKYSAYGTPFGLPGADTDSDGDCDATDITQIQTWIDASAYDVRGDVDLDGDVDATDKTVAQNNYQGTTSGWNDLTAVGNRKGYAGYEWDQAVGKYHVRNRVLDPVLGRWTRRDPLGYVDGMSLYEYVGSRVVMRRDPMGLAWRYGGVGPSDPYPKGDDCVDSSNTLEQCLDCCITADGTIEEECSTACFNQPWPKDPRKDPKRNPPDWNKPRCKGNCYRFATCSPNPNDPYGEPPGLPRFGSKNCNCQQLQNAMRGVGALDTLPDGSCPDSSYKIALLVNTGNCDFHFYRENPDGSWSDKPGCEPVNPPFKDPKKEWDRRRKNNSSPYDLFCGYMCWPFEKIIM